MVFFLKIIRKVLLGLLIISAIPSIILGICVKSIDRLLSGRPTNPKKILSNKIEKVYNKRGISGLKLAMKDLSRKCVRCPECRGKNIGTGYYQYDCTLCCNQGSLFKKDY